MKIISKYKDYYDYLIGVWGSDPIIVLDRTKYDHLVPRDVQPNNHEEYQFFICGKMISGYKLKGIEKILFKDDLKPFVKVHEYDKSIYFKREWMNHSWRMNKLNLDLIEDATRLNEKENCPILVKYANNIYHFPILSLFNFNRAISAEEIYLMITEWLGRDKIHLNPISNSEKIVLHGFDTRTSFRNV